MSSFHAYSSRAGLFDAAMAVNGGECHRVSVGLEEMFVMVEKFARRKSSGEERALVRQDIASTLYLLASWAVSFR